MNKKGQGALEYLLLIGGAILVAVVVITVLSGIGQSGATQTEQTAATGLCTAKTDQVGCTAVTVGNCTIACSDPNPPGTGGSPANLGDYCVPAQACT